MSVDLTAIQSLTTQMTSLNQSLAKTTDPAARAVIQSELDVVQAQLTSAINLAQQQSTSWSNILGGLAGLSALSSAGVNLSGVNLNTFFRAATTL